jgi:hypothetical protein
MSASESRYYPIAIGNNLTGLGQVISSAHSYFQIQYTRFWRRKLGRGNAILSRSNAVPLAFAPKMTYVTGVNLKLGSNSDQDSVG